MEFKKFLSWSIFLLFTLIMIPGLSAAEKDIVQKDPSSVLYSTLDTVEEHLHKARDYVDRKLYSEASSVIREAAAVLNRVEPSGPGDDRMNLTVAISRVAEAAIPAVVHVEVTQRRAVPNPLLPYEENPLLRQYFGLPKNMPKKFEQEMKGLGTGFIVDQDGHIMTDNHVVEGASEIKVVLSNGEEYPGKVVGTDPKTDLAVIKIDANKPLPFIRFGDSDKVRVAQWVVAIGSPRGLDQTVTQGIVSAKHRTGISDPSDYQDFLQTDAPINPGNSGGPLLNLEGEVVGVNSAIATQSGGFEGLGFAIPSNMAVHVGNALISQGKVERGWLGVSIRDVTPDKAKAMGISPDEGALVANVMKGGPADKAGVKKGDVILEYQGQKVTNASYLRNQVAVSKAGEDAKLRVLRDGKHEDMTVTIGNLEELRQKMASQVKRQLGAVVGPVTDQDAEKYGMQNRIGVVIQWIDPNGPLAKAGFEKGDLILAIGEHPIESVDAFIDMIEAIPRNKKVPMVALDHKTGQQGVVQVNIG